MSITTPAVNTIAKVPTIEYSGILSSQSSNGLHLDKNSVTTIKIMTAAKNVPRHKSSGVNNPPRISDGK